MMSINLGIVIIITIIATITDLKKREVPDYISYFLIIFGLMSHAIISILQNSMYPFLLSAVGTIALYIFGSVLYYSGMWGGGDAKLITGYGANLTTFPAMMLWPFILTIIFNILFFGAIMGLVWGAFLAVKHKKKFIKEGKKILYKQKKIVISLYLTLILTIILFAFKQSLIIPFIWGLTVVLFYLLISLKSIENSCMYRYIKPKDLVEGDWITEEIKIKNKIVYKPERTGISKKFIEKLQELEKQNKLEQVTVKEGLPYVPAFLIALIFTILGVDVMFYIFNVLL
jgi:Flp pilus assembly protein protease CpaA